MVLLVSTNRQENNKNSIQSTNPLNSNFMIDDFTSNILFQKSLLKNKQKTSYAKSEFLCSMLIFKIFINSQI